MIRKDAVFKRNIEEQRKNLYKLATQKGYTDPEVVQFSQQLDIEIYKLQVSCIKISNKE